MSADNYNIHSQELSTERWGRTTGYVWVVEIKLDIEVQFYYWASILLLIYSKVTEYKIEGCRTDSVCSEHKPNILTKGIF